MFQISILERLLKDHVTLN